MSEASAPSGNPPEDKKVVEVVMLNHDIYKRFEKSLGLNPIIDRGADAATDAAFKLGVQYVLKKLREELCIR